MTDQGRTKVDLLRSLVVGSRVAEDEIDALAAYFVETDQWQRILSGDVDIVFGPKGSGKSAIYTTLVSREIDLVDKGILLVAGENPRGAPAFSDLVAEPPTSEVEFIGIWKLYVLSLLSELLQEESIHTEGAKRLRELLTDAGLAGGPDGLRGLVRRVREYLGRLLNPESIEGGFKVDPSGTPAFTARITLSEPSTDERRRGAVSVDELVALGASELKRANATAWVVFDRLDVAFADSRDLEANALRALFKVYLDFLSIESIRIKIFLRTDIWQAITREGFREASHITRTVTIQWDPPSLLNLVVRRLLQSSQLVSVFEVSAVEVLRDSSQQRAFFDRLVPDQVDSGRNPRTWEWMLGRVSDSTRQPAPRELIHLLDQLKEVQVKMLERGEEEPANGMLFTRQAFRDALPEVSRVRLEQTLYAEYPALRHYLEALEGAKTEQSSESLALLWDLSQEQATETADQLVGIGFFERRGSRTEPEYWVPFLYRPALKMVQGSAD